MITRNLEQNLINYDIEHFPLLQKTTQNLWQPFDRKYHVQTISNLNDAFKSLFNAIAQLDHFVGLPFMEINNEQFASFVMQHFSEYSDATKLKLLYFKMNNF